MLDQYVKDIQNWPYPTSCKEMSSFLGFTGYYRGFILRYSALTNRMNSLKKAEKFLWTEDNGEGFLGVEGGVFSRAVEAYPDFDSDEPFILTTDWSSLNIAGVLSQKQDGVELFQGCWGRSVIATRDTTPEQRESSLPW